MRNKEKELKAKGGNEAKKRREIIGKRKGGKGGRILKINYSSTY